MKAIRKANIAPDGKMLSLKMSRYGRVVKFDMITYGGCCQPMIWYEDEVPTNPQKMQNVRQFCVIVPKPGEPVAFDSSVKYVDHCCTECPGLDSCTLVEHYLFETVKPREIPEETVKMDKLTRVGECTGCSTSEPSA
jgi:hypothetical protein